MGQDYASTVDAGKRFSVQGQLFKKVRITPEEDDAFAVIAKNPDAWPGALATFYSAKLMELRLHEHSQEVVRAAQILEAGLIKHSEALVNAGKASEKHASRLTWATWALFAATAALVIVGLLQAWILFNNAVGQ